MVRAIVSHGEIRPIEPWPSDWQEGQSLRIEKADDSDATIEDINRDFAELEMLCQSSDPVDEVQMQRALEDARRQSKEQVRRQMGLAE